MLGPRLGRWADARVHARAAARLGHERAGTSQMIFGGALYVPKKCDLTRDPVVRHEGPVGQMLVIDVYKKPEFCTTPKYVEYT